jgi:hypothetical protein
VVDYEAGHVAEAVRTETRAIAVAGDNQEVDPLGDGAQDLALYSSVTTKKLRVLSSQPRGRGLQDFGCHVVRDLFETARGLVSLKGATEESRGCRRGELADIGGRYVEQRDPRVGGDDVGSGIEAPLPRALDQPDDDPHRTQSSHQFQR